MSELRCKCGKEISKREKQLNAGLCDACLQAALRAEAKRIAKRLGK
jgi:NMD protein affecting ribosome stability and mRNA decay